MNLDNAESVIKGFVKSKYMAKFISRRDSLIIEEAKQLI